MQEWLLLLGMAAATLAAMVSAAVATYQRKQARAAANVTAQLGGLSPNEVPVAFRIQRPMSTSGAVWAGRAADTYDRFSADVSVRIAAMLDDLYGARHGLPTEMTARVLELSAENTLLRDKLRGLQASDTSSERVETTAPQDVALGQADVRPWA